jgi:hypothetical protein
MSLRTALTTLAVAGSLTIACGGTTERATAPTPPAAATCDASRVQWAVGQRASDALLERARVEANARSARFLRPDQPVTMEFLASRLNLGLNETDVVRSVTCG